MSVWVRRPPAVRCRVTTQRPAKPLAISSPTANPNDGVGIGVVAGDGPRGVRCRACDLRIATATQRSVTRQSDNLRQGGGIEPNAAGREPKRTAYDHVQDGAMTDSDPFL